LYSEKGKQIVEHFEKFTIFLLATPGQFDAHLPVVLEVGLLAVDDDRVIDVASDPPQQFQEAIVLLSG
jgi:hypothetical protein